MADHPSCVRWVVWAAAFAAMACSAGVTGREGDELSSCAAGQTLKGVDVSDYQGTVDWSTAKAAGVTFGFVKATEGDTLVDSTFAQNWSAMKAAGVVRGAYHFFHPGDNATTQASFVLSTVGPLAAGDLPIVLDFEVLDGVAEATAVADAVTFLATVTKATGTTAILYMSADFLSGSYAALKPYTLWVANYGVTCPGLPSEWSAWSFWQNSGSGSVSGISGETDTDVFNGSLSQLTALAGGTNNNTNHDSSTTCALGGHTYPQNTCTETEQCDAGSWVARANDSSTCPTAIEPNGACVTDTGTVVAQATCTSTLQCDDGVWVDRVDDPAACLGTTTTSCDLGGQTYPENTCTETLQCDSGSWVARASDASSCDSGVEPNGACITDTGTVAAENTCTTSLQCDDGVWVERDSDPTSCL